ncbi:MAG: alpha/beta fold hydrolase [Ruminococcaceae bacterium]|nr:alpha/beta fold hydrolase [Oscillospiraceae bacterium]
MIFGKKIEKIYKSQLFGRCDDNGTVFYFSSDDFENLRKEPYSFISSSNYKLQGYFYDYDNFDEKRLIVFDHGYGGGHRSYMKEIEMLCRKGYKVFAYDHTGCMESEGESTYGLGRSLMDLDDCINVLKCDKGYEEENISVVGHSWGAYSTMNIVSLHPKISHIAAISGFVSVEQMIKQNFQGILALYRKSLYDLEKSVNGRYAGFNGVDTLKNTDARVLLIYSEDDPMVKKEFHYDILKDALKDRDNIRFILTEGKGHNPNFTCDAVKYKDGFFAELTNKLKNKELSDEESKKRFKDGYDWNRMTSQDEALWNEIYAFLES